MSVYKVEICGVNTSRLPLLKNEEKEELFGRILEGDQEAREQYIKGNLRLVLSVIQRFAGNGDNLDDLFQIGCIGLIKAIDNFDVTQNVKFSTYAVPMMVGGGKKKTVVKKGACDYNGIRCETCAGLQAPRKWYRGVSERMKKKDMTAGKEWSTILLFSLPMMGANLLQVLYNFADSVIVGNFVSSTALGAIGLTGSMTWLLLTFCTGLGNGTNIAVSQFFGAKKEREIREVIAASYLLAVVMSLLITAVCFLAARPIIFGFLQTPAEMRPVSLRYFLIYSAGILFQMLYNVTYGILRAHGDSRGALLFLLISSVTNVVLDCLFVIVFHWGVTGAAVATVISQAGSAIASILYMHHYDPELMPERKYLSAWASRFRLLLRLSLPITFQSMISALGFTVLQRLVNTFGAASIEGYAAMQKIEQVAHIPSNSFHTAIASFVGQNIGAGQTERARRGYRATICMGVGISAVLCVLVLLADDTLLGMFHIAGEAMVRGREHLDLLMLFIWTSTITNITCGFLQGAGDVKIPAVSGFVNLGIRLGLSYLFAALALGYRSYFISMPPAWCITCLFVFLRYRSGKWQQYRIT